MYSTITNSNNFQYNTKSELYVKNDLIYNTIFIICLYIIYLIYINYNVLYNFILNFDDEDNNFFDFDIDSGIEDDLSDWSDSDYENNTYILENN